ncbi:MAG: preprotein translocase subunit SecG [Saccharofermentanales bacterium]|jgi:preprotein translocase subunit SecG
MKAAQIIFIILDLIACIGLVTTVMMQDSKSQGLGVLSGDSSADTFYGRTKGRTKEGILKRLTTGFAIAFAVFSVVLYLLTGRGV